VRTASDGGGIAKWLWLQHFRAVRGTQSQATVRALLWGPPHVRTALESCIRELAPRPRAAPPPGLGTR